MIIHYQALTRRILTHPRIRRDFSQWSVDSEKGVVCFQGKPRYQTVIGLEIHAQLDISTKLFSGCPVDGNHRGTGCGSTSPTSLSSSSSLSSLFQKPNTSVWPLDVAVPGVLPRLSQEAVQAAVLSAAATKCELPRVSRFERKHYFYADLPLGYQVTQQRWPLAREGRLRCQRSNRGNKKAKPSKKSRMAGDDDNDDSFTVRIERIQLEQDTGKTVIMTNPKTRRKESLVDFNRAGRALIEIVFYPDLRSSVDAATAVETLRSLLKHIGTCSGRMEDGSLRCDLNVSIAPLENMDQEKTSITTQNKDHAIVQHTGNRVEVKNLNSLRQVQLAAEYEAIRQAEAAANGSPTLQETRTFDVKTNQTVTIRTKEVAKDYRFMPEPDLPPLILNEEVFGTPGMDLEGFLESNLPELPEDAQRRLKTSYGLSDYMASVLTGDPPAIELFDTAVHHANRQLTMDRERKKVPETVANLLCNELFALVRELEMQRLIEEGILDGTGETSVRFSRVDGNQLGEVVALVLEGSISNTMAKQLLRVLYEESNELKQFSAREVAQKRGFQLISDSVELAKIAHRVIAENPEEMERYKLGGKFARKITKFLLGKSMAASQGNAHPERLNEVLVEVLEEIAPLSKE
mmetsp:Transcript_30321/g.50374  ORF Transcript_30321/g.50374 Transcript_30321/m.50374 type:complete len:632 (-) Transcript_30321:224-2119(-)|eukprot:CAMPEP_0178752580 /NCGR_PEP_ID=MMETSP0744-20121128/11139_1 /TAXON_ID=913974 /ORGANISM="Nitzschia punctata, Strain CCMP561" /LENGTH=631 /DNA_ID=CAMNT_0020406309 /DNA_START=1 /DNA_END=1896 /DNA_ORIENTATION=+